MKVENSASYQGDANTGETAIGGLVHRMNKKSRVKWEGGNWMLRRDGYERKPAEKEAEPLNDDILRGNFAPNNIRWTEERRQVYHHRSENPRGTT